MKKKHILLWLIIVPFLLGPRYGCAEDQISWIYLGFPPVHIEDGPLKGQGYGDFVLNLLIDNLDGYDHHRLKCNVARALAMLQNQEHVGHPAFLKRSDRDRYVETSIPAYVLIPNGVLALKGRLGSLTPYINRQGRFLLDKAIEQSDLTVGISAERAYGQAIDETLARYKDHENIVVRFDGGLLLEKLVLMMNSGRIDYVIGYPMEGQYYAKLIGGHLDIVSIPVEGMPDYLLGYIGFPKNEWGRSVMSKVNAVLMKNRSTPAYRAAYEFWLDENSINRYRKYAEEVFDAK